MTALQALILAIVQGITELFPVSSLGHAVILPDLLHWNLDQDGAAFLPFLVVMHLGTALALLLYFWRTWFAFGMAVVLNRGERPAAERRLFWRVVVATIPAVVVGGLLEHVIRGFFASGLLAASFLIVNGVVLFATDRIRKPVARPLDQMSFADALVVGAFQCSALIPGISRSGITMVGGLLRGFDHEESARFSFLTGTPIIIGATVLEGPKILKAHSHIGGLALMAGLVSGVVAFVSLWLLMRWFKRTEFKALDPFAFYCWAAGALSIAILVLRR